MGGYCIHFVPVLILRLGAAVQSETETCFKALISVIEKGPVPTDSPGREDAGHLLHLYPSAD